MLPVSLLEPRLVASLRAGSRLVLSAPPGSGKSTQLPRILLQNGFLDAGECVVLQPRRIAARMLAARVAEELASPLGREVGYQVRFENVTSRDTKIRFVTEGLLLRQMVADPGLKGVSVLVLDEFHERHLHGDATLGMALDVQERLRPDLKIVVMSATLDAGRLEGYLGGCQVIATEGRQFPVRVSWEAGDPATPVWERAADAVDRWIARGGTGDALVFMPGGFEIARTLEALSLRPGTRDRRLLPLHGDLPPRDQDAAVAPGGTPRVVVATNVAETSLTIEGVRLVVDSGLARLPRHDPWRGVNTLHIEPISRASADQRAGRAGRTAPGECIRLWSEEEHRKRPEREEPEARRLELSEIVLALRGAGVGDVRAFRWPDPPPEKALSGAEQLLEDLGALENGALAPLGRRILAFPTHPRWGRMLLAAAEAGCVRRACLVAALAQGREVLDRRADAFAHERRDDLLGDRDTSDFHLHVRAFELAREEDFRVEACRRAGVHAQAARAAAQACAQLLAIARRENLDAADRDVPESALRRSILAAFPDRVARRVDGATLRCEVVHARRGVLARESVVRRAPLLVAAEIRELDGRAQAQGALLSLVTAIEPAWLTELFPSQVSRRTVAKFDGESKRVVAEEVTRFRDLAIDRRPVPPPPDDAARLLADEVLAGRLVPDAWDASVSQWIERVNFLARVCPDSGIPAIGSDDRRTLAEQLCAGAVSWKELKGRAVMPVMRGWLSGAQQALLERHAPERLELPNGRRPKVVYEAEAVPHLALRIQELYDVPKIPAIAMGRVVPLLHILAPSQRPVQVTADLAGFWRDHYPNIKRELQRKYPKHEWR